MLGFFSTFNNTSNSTDINNDEHSIEGPSSAAIALIIIGISVFGSTLYCIWRKYNQHIQNSNVYHIRTEISGINPENSAVMNVSHQSYENNLPSPPPNSHANSVDSNHSQVRSFSMESPHAVPASSENPNDTTIGQDQSVPYFVTASPENSRSTSVALDKPNTFVVIRAHSQRPDTPYNIPTNRVIQENEFSERPNTKPAF